MPLRLDSQSADFAERFPPFSASSARRRRTSSRPCARIIADVRGARRRALVELTREIRPRRSRQGRHARDARPRSTPRRQACDARGARRAQARARPHRGLSPAPEAEGRALHRRARRRDGLALDRDRSGRPLRAGRHRGLSVVGADERGAGQGRRLPRLVMVVPAPDGKLSPLVLAAAKLAGVDEIYRIGGAQAVAALAYGTETIEPVAKIVGPGNAYVAAAKRLVFGQVGIDMIAGPVRGAHPRRQDRQCRLDRRRSAGAGRARCQRAIDPDHRRCRARRRKSRRRWTRSSRRCRAPKSPARRGAISAPSSRCAKLADAVALVDRLAPEHLEIAADECRSAGRAKSAMPARSSSARTRRKRSAITSPAPTTCCRPRARRASRPASACSIS